MSTFNSKKILGKTILQLQELMDEGELTAEVLTQFYIDRIYQYDKKGPSINSVLEINPDAIQIAKSLDSERKKGAIRSHIHGIPVLVKDNIATADKMRTTNGSYLFMDAKPKNDATIVSLLRNAGAIILGKTNMDEMACCNGIFSGRGGAVRNPYNLQHFANGSSSGAAAAVASDFAVFSIGTDTVSSVRFPASTNSLFGLKPTFGLMSRAGIIPGDIHLDTVGPITRCAEDAAIVVDILAAEDNLDISTKLENRIDQQCLDSVNSKKIESLKIGIIRNGFFDFNPDVDNVINANISFLKQQGVHIIDDLSLEQKSFTNGKEDDHLLSASRMWALDHYLKGLSEDSPVQSIHQLAHASWYTILPTLLPLFKSRVAQGIEHLSFENFPIHHPDVQATHHRCMHEQRARLIAIMDKYDLDFITFPTVSSIPDQLVLSEGKNPHYIENRGNPELASYSGLPEITIPAGYSKNGFSVGISFLGRAFSESDLIAFANAFEKATKHRKLPDLTKKISPLKKSIPSIPENNFFENRLALENSNNTIDGNLARASLQAFEPRFSPRNVDRSIWFSFTAKENGVLEISTQKSHKHLYDIAVYTGTELKELELVTFNHWNHSTKNTEVSLEVTKNETYAITLGANILTVASGYYELTSTFIIP